MTTRGYVDYMLRHCRRNKASFLFGSVCMSLCLCCLLLLTNLGWSYKTSAQRFTEQRCGSADVTVWDMTAAKVEEARQDSAFAKQGVVSVFGIQRLSDTVFDTSVVAGALDETAQLLTNLTLTQGRLAQTEDEAVLEQTLCRRLGLSVGDTQRFTLSLLGSDMQTEKTFTIVGICMDYALSQSGQRDNSLPVRALPNLLTTQDCLQALLGGERIRHMLLQCKDRELSREALAGVLAPYADIASDAVTVNRGDAGDVSLLRGGIESGTKALFGMLVGGGVFVVLLSLLCNAWGARRQAREDIRNWKLAGASLGDLRWFLLLREVLTMLPALPAGVLLSTLLLWAFREKVASLLLETFTVSVHPLLSVSAVLLCVALSFLFSYGGLLRVLRQRPLAVSESALLPRRSFCNRNFPTRNPSVLLCVKSASLYRRKTVAVFLLLALGITFFVSGTVVSDALVQDLQSMAVNDYVLLLYDGSFVSQLAIPLQPRFGLAEADVEALRTEKELQILSAVRLLPVLLVSDRGVPNRTLENTAGIDRAVLQAEKARFGFSDGEYLQPARLAGVDDSLLDRLAPYVTEGSIDRDALQSGQAVLWVQTDTAAQDRQGLFAVGDTVRLSQFFLDGAVDFSGDTPVAGERRDVQPRICASISLRGCPEAELVEMSGLTEGFVTVHSAFDSFSFPVKTNAVYANLVNPDDADDAEALFAALRTSYPTLTISSRLGDAAQLDLLCTGSELTARLLVLAVAGFSLATLCSLVGRRLAEQEKTFAILRSMGYTQTRAVLTQFSEYAVQILSALLLGTLLSWSVNFFFNRLTFAEAFPWASVFAAAGITLGGVLLAIWIPFRRFYKRDVCVLLR